MPSTPKLRWNTLARPEEWCLVARNPIGLINPGGFHSHDFCELFWVEEGSGIHRINTTEQSLSPGALCFIRARDRHSIHGAEPAGVTIVNVAFRSGVVEETVARASGLARLAFNPAKRAAPRILLLSALELEQLKEAFERLVQPPRDRFAVELFLLTAMSLAGPHSSHRGGVAPDWLLRAVEQTRKPEFFPSGVSEFFHAAGRSAEHVTRETRKHFGCTPGDLINRARLDHAARELELSSKNITELAFDCGFQSLSHFIRLFRKRFGEPPLRYRRRRWGLA